jgi:hypothetical protein
MIQGLLKEDGPEAGDFGGQELEADISHDG